MAEHIAAWREAQCHAAQRARAPLRRRRNACGAIAAVLLACLAPAGAQKSAAGSARAQERTRGSVDFRSANTDITGLRMEDVVENMRGALDRSSNSLRMSTLPLAEISKITHELQNAVAKKGPPEKRWLEAGNVARYNGLSAEPYITVPVTMNLIFIGFSGDGHYKLNLAEEELKPWFEHMEHRMEHTLVPTNDAPDASHPTRNTHIYYKYDFHVLELHPDVDAIIEAIIWDNARAEDPWGEPAIKWTSQDMHQVDITPMENALADLVDCLRLNNSYTLFLMNPKLPYPDFNYGYRYGFSKAELDHLHENASLVRDLMGREKVRPVMKMTPELKEDVHTLHAQVKSFQGEDPEEKERTLARQRAKLNRLVDEKSNEVEGGGVGGSKGKIHKIPGEKPLPRGHPEYRDMRDLSQSWAALYKQALHDLSYWQRHPAEEAAEPDDEGEEEAYTQELKTLWGSRKDSPMPPDMLFEVMAARLLQAKSKEDREYFRSAAEDKHTQEDCIVDNWVSTKRFAFIDFSAGPFEWGPIVGGKRVRSFRTIPDIISLQTSATDFTVGGQWKDPSYVNRMQRELREHGLEKLEDEKKLLLVFLRQQCSNNHHNVQGDTCKELRHKLSAVEAFIKTHTRVETTDTETIQHLSLVTGGPHEGANISLVQHSMFAKLGGIIQSTQRQLVTPSASALPAPFKANVYFHVYIISNHETYKPDAPQHFDYLKFQQEMMQFRLPRQNFHFVLHKYSMAEDHALTVAFANALRSAVVATLKVDGRFVATKRMYLDSQVLQKHLQLLHDHLTAGDKDESAVNKRDIPIFLFSMDVPLPVFIDKHYQARALDDMVIAVQSDEKEWESHLSCNSKAIVWNLRNPLRSVLAATVHHLAGLLSMHLSYDDAHGKVSQDWLWSVGCSPLSNTASRLANFSQFHVDSAQRNQVVDILSESIQLANEGIRCLEATHTNLDNLPAGAAVPHDRLVQMHVAVQLSWTKTTQSLHRLDFQSAIPDAHTALRNAKHFRDLALHTQELMLLSSCLHPLHNKPFDWGMVMMVASAVGCVALYYLMAPARTKPKLN